MCKPLNPPLAAIVLFISDFLALSHHLSLLNSPCCQPTIPPSLFYCFFKLQPKPITFELQKGTRSLAGTFPFPEVLRSFQSDSHLHGAPSSEFEQPPIGDKEEEVQPPRTLSQTEEKHRHSSSMRVQGIFLELADLPGASSSELKHTLPKTKEKGVRPPRTCDQIPSCCPTKLHLLKVKLLHLDG